MMSKPRVLLMHAAGIRRFENTDALERRIRDRLPEVDLQVSRNSEETAEMLQDANVIVTSQFPTELLKKATNLQWIQALSSGVDFYDLAKIDERDIILTNSAGAHSESIAEHVLCFMLMFERNALQGMKQQRKGTWKRYEGGELRNKTVGIIGVGAVGSRVAELCNTFGMHVMGIKRDLNTMSETVDEPLGQDGLFTLLAKSDYVVVACPLNEGTRRLLGGEELKAMKPSAVLVNIGRGEVVDEKVLIEVLQQGAIRGAALDVFEKEPLHENSPLWSLPNVLLTPHNAGSTPRKKDRIINIFEKNYRLFINGNEESFRNRIV